MTFNAAIKKIDYGIRNQLDVVYFINIYRKVFGLLHFSAFDTKHSSFYRARHTSNQELFKHVDELKYPPANCVTERGRLNDIGESVAYMSAGQLAPIAEMDFDYYQFFCMAEIEYCKQDIYFFDIGIKAQREGWTRESLEFIEYLNGLLISPSKENYPATIALYQTMIRKDTLDGEMKLYTGLAYNSAQEHKTNQILHNIAVNAQTFDDCFKISSASYYLMAFSSQKTNVLQEINRSLICEDGSIAWEKSFDEMTEYCNREYGNNCFYAEITEGMPCVIKYSEGSGRVIDSDNMHYVVNFNKLDKIMKIDKDFVIMEE